jgi:broad specificity phosphatase PhoE
MKLIITRHGQTHWNKKNPGILQGSSDIELSDEGKEQAKKLALRLKEHEIELIFSSPLKRALSTAKEIKKYHPKAKLIVEKDLTELDFGIFEGLTIEEAKEKFKDIWDAREKDKMNYKIPKGESYIEGEKRALKVLEKIIKLNKDAVIVAHGAINKLLFKKLLNQSLEEVGKHHFWNTSVSVLNINKAEVVVEEFNCDKHLKE